LQQRLDDFSAKYEKQNNDTFIAYQVVSFNLGIQKEFSLYDGKSLINIDDMSNLYRSNDRVIAGVCAGISEHFGWDTGTIRIITLILILFGGVSIWVYVIFWIILPSRNFKDRSGNFFENDFRNNSGRGRRRR